MAIVGTQQSPVRILRPGTFKAEFPRNYVKIRYPNRALAGAFSGPKDLNFLFAAPHVQIPFDGKHWDFRKIHIHLKSEHRFDQDEPADFEAHLVHLLPGDVEGTGPKVVVGVLFRKGERAAASKKGLARLNRTFRERAEGGGTPDRGGIEINPAHFLPADPDRWYHYEGSLTSGSFSEDVSWFVMADEISVSPGDTAELEKQAEQHARGVFDLNRRFVLRSF